MRLSRLCLSLLLLVSATACNRDSRLQGKWIFDRPYTEAQMAKQPKPTPAKDPSLLGAMKPMADALAPMLVSQLEGVNLTITAKEMMYTLKNGTGQSQTYEIIDRPGHNTWRVKTSDGKIETYTREDDHLVTGATGNLSDLKLYFSPAGK